MSHNLFNLVSNMYKNIIRSRKFKIGKKRTSVKFDTRSTEQDICFSITRLQDYKLTCALLLDIKTLICLVRYCLSHE